MIYLRTMSNSEFDEFKIESQNTYAIDLAKAEDISIDEARRYASEQFNRLVPNGIQTSGHFFYQVISKQAEQSIGYLWLGLQNRFGRKVVSINDITIDSSYRGRGLGKALMKLVEEESRKAGADRIRLHVFQNNEVAKNLYLAMGFVPTNIDMRKDL